MAKSFLTASYDRLLPYGFGGMLRQRLAECGGFGLIGLAAALLVALASFNQADPSLNSVTGSKPQNLLGAQGAYAADFLLQSFGLGGALPAIALAIWGWRLVRKQTLSLIWFRLAMLVAALILLAVGLGFLPKPSGWPLMAGLGGAVGGALFGYASGLALAVGIDGRWFAACAWMLGLTALIPAFGFTWSEWAAGLSKFLEKGAALMRGGPLFPRTGLSARNGDFILPPPGIHAGASLDAGIGERRMTKNAAGDASGAIVDLAEPRLYRTKTGKRARVALQGNLDLCPDGEYQPPPLDLLESPPDAAAAISREALQQNALLLEKVLDDFGVNGQIARVRPGPVVTLYELEPAPGIKTSRVISLSDDIARSMSAVSVRAAVVPGRNVIGIELPNVRREMVFLRELLAANELDRGHGMLKIMLGKDIGGAPVFADLSRMPHLLIAGTTGSGKSVAINTMILSLLYQLTPDQCRLIMIDPKMLELSVYDGIPHLLTPVVTDPSKAIVALKWAVREMEERYRSMSQLGVRNIAGYNARLAEAKKKNETLTRRVQTGFDENGKPFFEEQPLSMKPLPFIIVVVDEMADLMMVAGKEIEIAVQRLAQMARAAGIHVIMATQRPSVDVITGTIKANFPTRISFQVTSRIDSRTILGEQGAEQLLGQGDMLYMAGGGRIMRVHGPFVSDLEVEQVVDHLKSQGEPSYIEAVTEDEDENPFFSDGGEISDELYDKAVNIVAEEGKASTSFIQRRLQIGYNRAARLIERMEAEGIVSKANRVGRREVLAAADRKYSA